MAIITDLSSAYFRQIQQIPEIEDYLKDMSEICARINDQDQSMIKRDLGAGIYALEQSFVTKKLRNCFYESHKKYVDVQIMLEGAELMQLFDISNEHAQLLSYNEKTDFCVYDVNSEIVTNLLMSCGDVYVFFPRDGHLGMLENIKSSSVKKTVIKIPYEKYSESLSLRWQ